MNIVLFGPPGAGKGTQAKLICEKYFLNHLSTGDLLRKESSKETSLGIQINTANVSTYGDRVVDIFYIKNAFGSKVYDKLTIDKIKKSILNILKEINYTELN